MRRQIGIPLDAAAELAEHSAAQHWASLFLLRANLLKARAHGAYEEALYARTAPQQTRLNRPTGNIAIEQCRHDLARIQGALHVLGEYGLIEPPYIFGYLNMCSPTSRTTEKKEMR